MEGSTRGPSAPSKTTSLTGPRPLQPRASDPSLLQSTSEEQTISSHSTALGLPGNRAKSSVYVVPESIRAKNDDAKSTSVEGSVEGQDMGILASAPILPEAGTSLSSPKSTPSSASSAKSIFNMFWSKTSEKAKGLSSDITYQAKLVAQSARQNIQKWRKNENPSAVIVDLYKSNLDDIMLHTSFGRDVPAVMYRCIDYIERQGIDEIGIYRLSGALLTINSLKATFDKGQDVDLDELYIDVHAAASLLKAFLRTLTFIPESDQKQMLLLCGEGPECARSLYAFTSKLPEQHYSILAMLFHHLHRIQANSSVNKMTAGNLHVIFHPTLHIFMNILEACIMFPHETFPLLPNASQPRGIRPSLLAIPSPPPAEDHGDKACDIDGLEDAQSKDVDEKDDDGFRMSFSPSEMDVPPPIPKKHASARLSARMSGIPTSADSPPLPISNRHGSIKGTTGVSAGLDDRQDGPLPDDIRGRDDPRAVGSLEEQPW